jgi:hypothetical protein
MVAEAIQKDKLETVLAQMKAASESYCVVLDDPTPEKLKRAMLAHERAADEAREFFYLTKSVAEEACSALGGHGNRLRNPLKIA